ncbi:hydroxyurea phosphotransferase, partial [Streptomyces lavendulae]
MIDVPDELVVYLRTLRGAVGREFADALPALAGRYLEEWGLRLDGAAMSGMCAMVLPVLREADGRPAALKLQLVDEETVGEPVALRVWGEAG